MYKLLTIGGREYKLEYTIEASLYDECTEKLINFMGNMVGAVEPEWPDGTTEEQKITVRKELLKNRISGVSNLPQTALSLFYAGLLEYHGANGDNTIRSKQDVKELVKKYFEEHVDDGTDNFYDLLMLCLEQMDEDGFFKRTGLEMMARNVDASKKNRAQRRAATKASAK